MYNKLIFLETKILSHVSNIFSIKPSIMAKSTTSLDENCKEVDTLIVENDEEMGGMCSKLIQTKSSRLGSMLALIGIYFLAEIVVGHITNSLTLVADSFHMLSDGLSLIVALTAVRMSKRKAHESITPWPSKQEYFNTFGWVRFEVVGALINATFLLALCISILMEAIEKFYDPHLVTKPELVLAVGGGGLLINLIGLVMFGSHAHGGHDHGHHDHGHHDSGSHDHDHSRKISQDKANGIHSTNQANAESGQPQKRKKVASADQMNMRAVFLHVLGDALGSVIVMISATVILLVPHRITTTVITPSNETVMVNGTNTTLPPTVTEETRTHNHWILYMDPVMSVLLVCIMVTTTIPLFKKSSLILLQTVPKKIKLHSIKQKMQTIKGVQELHDFHIWQLAGDKYVATVHLQCTDSQTYLRVAREMKEKLHDEDIHSLTIQPEFISETPARHCSMSCVSDNCKSKVCCEIEPDPPKKKTSKGSLSTPNDNVTEINEEHVTFNVSSSSIEETPDESNEV